MNLKNKKIKNNTNENIFLLTNKYIKEKIYKDEVIKEKIYKDEVIKEEILKDEVKEEVKEVNTQVSYSQSRWNRRIGNK